jgi:hypothetical protein
MIPWTNHRAMNSALRVEVLSQVAAQSHGQLMAQNSISILDPKGHPRAPTIPKPYQARILQSLYSSCDCRCHRKVRRYSTSLATAALIGALVITVEFSCTGCDCAPQKSQQLSLVYQFPPWLLRNHWVIKLQRSSLTVEAFIYRSGPMIALQHEIWLAIQYGDLNRVRRNFNRGKLSPKSFGDVNGFWVTLLAFTTQCLQPEIGYFLLENGGYPDADKDGG